MDTNVSQTERPPDAITGKAESHTRRAVNIAEINGIIPYGFYLDRNPVVCDPGPADIDQAIEAKTFESRGFQTHLHELEAEWANSSSVQEYCTKVKTYHARRIAHFVYYGWTEPIALTQDKKITDGLHRLRAASHKGLLEVEVIIS